jgi:hypothetical protein
MQSKATTVDAYLKELQPDRRAALQTLHNLILKKLPKGYAPAMQYGMITYVVPLKLYPKGYLGKKDVPLPYISLASQKNYMSLYLMNIYSDKKAYDAFEKAVKAAGKKLDMGKCCVRFKKLEELPMDVVGEVVASTPVNQFIAEYENAHAKRSKC